MKVIICGAGQVGSNIARYLAMEDNDVTVIDQSAELVRKISDSLDVQGLVGHASHPDVLERAGTRDADLLIAVTYADEINMVACQVAHSLFHVPTRIARVRNQSYLEPHWRDLFSRQHLPIDVIISPEIEVAHAITRRLSIPGAFEMISLVDDRVKLLGVRCSDQTPLLNTPLRQLTQLFPDLNIVIIGLVRNGKPRVPTRDDRMLEGDEVYFVVDSEHVGRAMTAFGFEKTDTRNVVIFGGGNIGLFLAQEIEAQFPGINTKIIEMNAERAAEIAHSLPKTVVLEGDVLDVDLLDEANIDAADTVVAVTNDDETNILASLLAKQHGVSRQRVITLVNKGTYENLITTLGIDAVINPRAITVSTILQHVRRGRIHAAHSLRDGFGELLEAVALETSPMVGKPLKDVKLPNGVILGAVVRNDKVISPRGDTVVEKGDRVVLFATADKVRKVENMFSVRLEFF